MTNDVRESQPELRVAVITGAAQGIGARIAEVLADEGYALGLIDRQRVHGFPARSSRPAT